MPSTKDYLDYVLELLNELDGIAYKKMMGEYLLYKDGVLFGGVYDNRFLIKNVKTLKGEGLSEEIPYEGAKPMLLVDSEDSEYIAELINKVIKSISASSR